MISVNDVSLAFGSKPLFKDVNIKFNSGNCYGLIGANGAGKSTFLKILSGQIIPDSGNISIGKNERIAVLEQDQFKYDDVEVLETVIRGHKRLFDIMKEKDELYAKENFSEEDGMKAAELEGEFADLNGWDAESDAAVLLSGLGIDEELHHKKMRELEAGEKVRILLAQAIFGNPDNLLLDEPTNNLDIESINWLENFLSRFENTVIVVSHDRHFLNRVCSHIADIDYSKIKVYTGNYEFWQKASQMLIQQIQNENKKKEEKAKELKAFIARFSSNASKAKQATSRKKQLEKLTLEDIPKSSRRFPFIQFSPERKCGDKILTIDNISKSIDGEEVIKDFSLTVNPGDKIAFLAQNDLFKTTLYQIITNEIQPDSGSFKWGVTTSIGYLPKENSKYFTEEIELIDWISQFSKVNELSYIRGFLGRMLFSNDDALKKANILSGGERVRCMISKMMLSNANILILDDPTNHLDLETITSLNNALIDFSEVILFSSHDHQFINTIANRIVEITPSGIIDRKMDFDSYFESAEIRAIRDEYYHGHKRVKI
jgi:ATPase subunit of ABC transporter with duplicated ATPase domains